MSQKLEFLVIHCSATPECRDVRPEDIIKMHKGPADVSGGVQYKGKTYASREALPKEFLKNADGTETQIKYVKGRGWMSLGYSDMLDLEGKLLNLSPYDEDDEVEHWEITNGVRGRNSISRHIVYIGGMTKDMYKPKDTRTPEQLLAMRNYVFQLLHAHPDIKVCGHNQFAAKACPSFDTAKWLESIGYPEKNIYRK